MEIIYKNAHTYAEDTPLDALFIAPHADDCEFFCGGTIAVLTQESRRVGIVDLTRVQYATRGDHEMRMKEAQAASHTLGLTVRANLGLPELFDPNGQAEHMTVVHAIRTFKPRMVIFPYGQERHPDHQSCHDLIRDALFEANLAKYPGGGSNLPPHQVSFALTYEMRREMPISFLVDISPVYEIKVKAIQCFESQILSSREKDKKFGNQSFMSMPGAFHALNSRTAYYGSMIGTAHAEPLFLDKAFGVKSPHFLLSDAIIGGGGFIMPARNLR